MFQRKRLTLNKYPVVRAGRQDEFFWNNYFPRKDSSTTKHKKLSLSEFKSVRQKLYPLIKCGLTTEQFYEYNGIDQMNEGACSLVGFLNMMNLENVPLSWNYKGHNFTKKDIINFWGDVWFEVEKLSSSADGMSDIAQMLDGIISIQLLTKKQIDSLQYVPIRSYGNAENSFNTMFTKGGNVFSNIANYMKKLIDEKHIFLVNSHEHTRVCIGYNETDFVFADSWGNKAHQTEKDPTGAKVNFIVAGYSFAPINMIASYIRDIVYWNPKGTGTPQATPVENITQVPTKPASIRPSPAPAIEPKKPSDPVRVVPTTLAPSVAKKTDCKTQFSELSYDKLQSVCKNVRENLELSTNELSCNKKRMKIVKDLCKFLN